jgi:holin-like protein
VPGGIVGLCVLLLAFALGWLSPRTFSGGARWLLAEMLLFFVPAMLVVTEYTGLIQHQGLRILAVIVASTACVMAATALAVDRVYRLELWLARRRSTRAGLRREQA